MATLARYFRWDEHFILWELPLCRGNAYHHALMRMHSIATEPAQINEEMEAMRNAL